MAIFEKATPIWMKIKRESINYQAGFRCDFNAEAEGECTLRITGATLYRIFINGEFVGYGPARAGDGYIRYDEITLNVNKGLNMLAVEVAGYNCPSFYTMKIASFLCAEIYKNGEVVA